MSENDISIANDLFNRTRNSFRRIAETDSNSQETYNTIIANISSIIDDALAGYTLVAITDPETGARITKDGHTITFSTKSNEGTDRTTTFRTGK